MAQFVTRRVRERHENEYQRALEELRIYWTEVKRPPEERVLSEYIEQIRQFGEAIRDSLGELGRSNAALFSQLQQQNSEAVRTFSSTLEKVSSQWQSILTSAQASSQQSAERMNEAARLAGLAFERVSGAFDQLGAAANQLASGFEDLRRMPADIIAQVQGLLVAHAEQWAGRLDAVAARLTAQLEQETSKWNQLLTAQTSALSTWADNIGRNLEGWQQEQQRRFQEWAEQIRQQDEGRGQRAEQAALHLEQVLNQSAENLAGAVRQQTAELHAASDQQRLGLQAWLEGMKAEQQTRQREGQEFVSSMMNQLFQGGTRLAEAFTLQAQQLRAESEGLVRSVVEALDRTYVKAHALVTASLTTAHTTSEQIRKASGDVSGFFVAMQHNFASFRDGTVAFQKTVESFSNRPDARNVLSEMEKAAKAQVEAMPAFQRVVEETFRQLSQEHAKQTEEILAFGLEISELLQRNTAACLGALNRMTTAVEGLPDAFARLEGARATTRRGRHEGGRGPREPKSTFEQVFPWTAAAVHFVAKAVGAGNRR